MIQANSIDISPVSSNNFVSLDVYSKYLVYFFELFTDRKYTHNKKGIDSLN